MKYFKFLLQCLCQAIVMWLLRHNQCFYVLCTTGLALTSMLFLENAVHWKGEGVLCLKSLIRMSRVQCRFRTEFAKQPSDRRTIQKWHATFKEVCCAPEKELDGHRLQLKQLNTCETPASRAPESEDWYQRHWQLSIPFCNYHFDVNKGSLLNIWEKNYENVNFSDLCVQFFATKTDDQ